LKLNPIQEILEGKKVVMVDDSVVRGTTCKQIVQMLRKVGVREVHLLVSSPPIHYPCYYGIDTSERNQLIAAKHTLDEIRKFIGADGLHYLSLEGMLKATGLPEKSFCAACFTGNYPIDVPHDLGKYFMESEVD
ncbi:MAG TPA: amidophosphoribosyltransferase, partial [Clostridia bacterium]|nr:amidophosphoribosyltransferase [Clostridia bacterium]